MELERFTTLLVGTLLGRRDERGISQSTENVILLVGAVAIAVVVIRLVMDYVNNSLTLLPW